MPSRTRRCEPCPTSRPPRCIWIERDPTHPTKSPSTGMRRWCSFSPVCYRRSSLGENWPNARAIPLYSTSRRLKWRPMPQPFTRKVLLTAGATLLLIPSQFAQAPSGGTGIPDGGTREVLVSIFIPSLPDAPFTATVNTEWVRPLGDGSRITLKNHRLIARDKNGRIFQERRLLVTEGGKQESVVTQTEITDPVAHQEYICKPQQHVSQLEEFQPLAR